MRRAAAWLAICPALAGCSTDWYHRSADEEVYQIVKHQEKTVLGEDRGFKVEPSPLPLAAAGSVGETEDLARTPAPEPIRAPVPSAPAPGAQSQPKPAEGAAVKSEAGNAEKPAGSPGEKASDNAAAQPTPGAEQPAPAPALPAPAEAPSGTTPAAPAQAAPGTALPPAGTAQPGAGAPQVAPASATGGQAGGRPEAASRQPAPFARAPRVPTRFLDLRSALRLAFANNRDYQRERESVYLAALSLTLAQYQFAPRFFGMVTGEWNRDSTGAESGSVAPSSGWNMLLVNGARLSITLAQSFFQFFTGDRREVARTIVSGTLTQPLLRGFGTEIVREPLTQAERDVTYQVRALERFRRTLAVSVISEFYRVLEARDRVTNSYLNWQSLVSNRDRVEALANAQRRPRFEVGQARTDELRAQDEWSGAVERYENALDRFKITLGVPTDEQVTLLQGELEQLARERVEPLGVTADAAIASALDQRLDLKTSRDEVEDAERRVRVAADGLRMQLDLNAAASLESNGRSAQTPLKLNANHLAYGFGFDLDLPLDRKAERNAFVGSLISLERQKRELSLLEDNIRLTVRDAHRRLEREIVSYGIQRASLALAEERVESTSLFLQAGKAQTRDVLDAQAALNSARNAVTSALISYTIARLELLRDAEALRASDDGKVTVSMLRTGSDGGA